MKDPEVRVRASHLQAAMKVLNQVREEHLEKAMRIGGILDVLARSPQVEEELPDPERPDAVEQVRE